MKTNTLFHFLFALGFLSCLSLKGKEDKPQLSTGLFSLPGNFNELGLKEGLSAQAILERHGVVFPSGSSARFIEVSSQLEVTNKREELLVAEAVVTFWNRIKNIGLEEEGEKRREQIEKKLKKIHIPLVVFEDTPLTQALEWLEKVSAEFDVSTQNEAEKGILISTEQIKKTESKPDLKEDSFGSGKQSIETGILNTRITLRLTDVPLSEALQYTLALSQLRYSVTEKGVFIPIYHRIEQSLETMVYAIPPGFNKHLKSILNDQISSECFPEDPFQEGDEKTISRDMTLREKMEYMGISFPIGSSVHILEARNLFVVKNHSHEIELIEALLRIVDAKASPDWKSQQKSLVKSKLATIQLPDLAFEKTPFQEVSARLKQEILHLDTESKIWRRGITVDLRKVDSDLWSEQWGRKISINLKNQTAAKSIEKLGDTLGWKVVINPRGVVFLTD